MENDVNNPSTPVESQEQNVSAETVNLQQTAVQNVNGTNVTLRQAGVQSVQAERLVVRQGGMMNAKTENLEMLQAGAGMIRTSQANLTASQAGIMISGGNVVMDQSAARVLVSGGEVSMDQGGAVLMIANRVRTQNSSTVFLFARTVEGDVRPAFGPRESVLFGAIAGLVAGVLLMLGGLFKRKRGR